MTLFEEILVAKKSPCSPLLSSLKRAAAQGPFREPPCPQQRQRSASEAATDPPPIAGREQAPAQSHSPTSQDAAEAIAESMPMLRARVLAFFEAQGAKGATDEEVQDALSMNPSTERPRRIELYDAGRLVDSGYWRLTRSGRKAVIWIVPEHGEVEDGKLVLDQENRRARKASRNVINHRLEGMTLLQLQRTLRLLEIAEKT